MDEFEFELIELRSVQSTIHLYSHLHAALPDIGYFGGDIILTPDQQLAMETSFDTQHSSTNVRRAVYRLSSKFWPNGRVPYVIDTSLGKCSAHLEARAAMIPEHTCPPHAGPRARVSIAQAIQTYKRTSCVRFVQRTDETDYVEFFKGRGYAITH